MIQRRFGVVWQACHSFGANYLRLIGATGDHAPLVRMKTSNVGPVLEGSAGAAPRPTGRGNSTPPHRDLDRPTSVRSAQDRWTEQVLYVAELEPSADAQRARDIHRHS